MKSKTKEIALVIIIASILIYIIWFAVLFSNASPRTKELVTGAVIISPIPPIP